MAHSMTTARGPQTTGMQRLAKRLGLTARPETVGERFRNSAAVWLVLMVYWAFSSVMLAVFPASGRQLPPFGAPIHLGVTLVGLAAIWCMHRSSFPAAWDARIPAQRRLLLPLLVGAVFGVLAIGIELYSGSLQSLQAITGREVTVGFPQSLVVYTSFSAFLELFYLVLPVSLLLWLIAGVVLRGRGETPTFWVLALIASAIELAEQGPSVVASATAAGGSIDLVGIVLYIVHNFGFNFSAAVLFRRYGLLAPILVRVGNYIVWHILFGHLYLDRML
jgi:hypothetical protein